jgi:hypothetical protein
MLSGLIGLILSARSKTSNSYPFPEASVSSSAAAAAAEMDLPPPIPIPPPNSPLVRRPRLDSLNTAPEIVEKYLKAERPDLWLAGGTVWPDLHTPRFSKNEMLQRCVFLTDAELDTLRVLDKELWKKVVYHLLLLGRDVKLPSFEIRDVTPPQSPMLKAFPQTICGGLFTLETPVAGGQTGGATSIALLSLP